MGFLHFDDLTKGFPLTSKLTPKEGHLQIGYYLCWMQLRKLLKIQFRK